MKKKKYSRHFFLFYQKLQFTDPYASIKDVIATGEAFNPQKRTSKTLKNKFIKFFYFWGWFLPFWIRIRIQGHHWNPDLIRWSGSAALLSNTPFINDIHEKWRFDLPMSRHSWRSSPLVWPWPQVGHARALASRRTSRTFRARCTACTCSLPRGPSSPVSVNVSWSRKNGGKPKTVSWSNQNGGKPKTVSWSKQNAGKPKMVSWSNKTPGNQRWSADQIKRRETKDGQLIKTKWRETKNQLSKNRQKSSISAG